MKKFLIIVAFVGLLGLAACDMPVTSTPAPSQPAGVAHATDVAVKTQASGLTTEQENVTHRLQEDNKPEAIKHLYVISAYSGQCIMYSTVKGKVTSSGKRLRPVTVSDHAGGGQYNDDSVDGYSFNANGVDYRSNELPQDDGTFGSSNEYIYWWDTQNRYHQVYVSGGTFITISDQPLPIKSITVNIEAVNEK